MHKATIFNRQPNLGAAGMEELSEELSGGFTLDDLFSPYIDESDDEVALVVAEHIPELQKPDLDRLLYDIAVAWLKARDADVLTEESDGDT